MHETKGKERVFKTHKVIADELSESERNSRRLLAALWELGYNFKHWLGRGRQAKLGESEIGPVKEAIRKLRRVN